MIRYGSILSVVLLLIAAPVSARILKTMKQALQAFTIGSGLEYQTDNEQSEFDFPFLLEYGFMENLKLTVEPNFVTIHKKSGGSIRGLGDFETALTYDFLSERRNRPGFSAEGIIKWPTAVNAEIGTGKTDYSLGLIVSKEFVHWDMDFNAVYTFIGSPPGVDLRNSIEGSLSAEWHLSRVIDLEGEIDAASGSGGGFHGQPGTIGGFANHGFDRNADQSENEYSLTLGIAEHLSDSFKLEEGVIAGLDGSWQAVFAWEWDFGESD